MNGRRSPRTRERSDGGSRAALEGGAIEWGPPPPAPPAARDYDAARPPVNGRALGWFELPLPEGRPIRAPKKLLVMPKCRGDLETARSVICVGVGSAVARRTGFQ